MMRVDAPACARFAARTSAAAASLWICLLLVSVPCAASGAPASATRRAASDTTGLATLSASLAPLRAQLDRGNGAGAESTARVILRQVKASHPGGSLHEARVLDVLVRSLVLQFRSAEPGVLDLAKRAVQLKEQRLGPNAPDLAESLTNLGDVYYFSDQGAPSIAPYQRALAIRERAPGDDHGAVADALHRLGDVYFSLGHFDDAHTPYQRELNIVRSQADSLRQGRALQALGLVEYQLGHVQEAIPLYESSLAIRTRKLGPEHPRVAEVMRYLALARSFSGEYESSLPMMERALAIQEKAYGPDDAQLAETLGDLAQMMMVLGRDAEARAQLERSLRIAEKVYAANSVEVAWCLDNLALHVSSMGDHGAARMSFQREVEILMSNPGAPTWLRATAMEHLGMEMAVTGDTAAARDLGQRALAACIAELGEKHYRVAESRENLATILDRCGDESGAERELRASIAMWDSLNGADHPSTVGRLNELADLTARRDPAAAESLYRRAAFILQATWGPDHPDRARSLIGLAGVLRVRGKPAEASDSAVAGESIARKHFQQTARVLTEKQALQYADARSSGLDLMLALAEQGSDASARGRVWDALIRSRADVLDEIAARGRAIAAAADSESARLAAAYTRATARLAHLTLRGPQDTPPEAFRALLDNARAERDRAEGALAERSAGFRREIWKQGIGLAEVRAALPVGDALVAFARYQAPSGPGPGSAPGSAGTYRYLAFVMVAGRPAIDAVPLGEAAPIDSLIARYSSEVRRRVVGDGAQVAEALYRRAAGPLRQRIWDPIAARLDSVRRVLIVPDGALNLVSFASLPVGESEYLIERGPLVHYLSSEREIVPDPHPPAPGRGLLALGGIDFDAAPAPGPEAGLVAAAAPGAGEESPQVRGRRSSCPEYGELRFAALPGTLIEARSVARIWKDQAKSKKGAATAEVMLLTGSDATKEQLASRSRARRVVHIATHGFDLVGLCTPSPADTSDRGNSGPQTGMSANAGGADPLLLTGLALAGANRTGSPAHEPDGVLTAAEVAATFDLSGVEWAVLSACETGTGGVRPGEGVFGLRRAFQIAGARTLIMSLWPVEDESTQQWMTALYRARFLTGMGSAEAIRDASLRTLEERRKRGAGGHPFFWAGFIGAGDWR